MLAEIPILINRKGSKIDDLAFKILPLDKKVKFSHRRQKTYDTTEKPRYQQRQHDTVDTNRLKQQQRYRRISSSGAVNKFPRDFFKGDLPNTPVKIRFSRSKKQNNMYSESFNKVKFEEIQIKSQKKSKKQYTIQSAQAGQEKTNQVQTPKFNNKILNQQQLYQAKSKTTNKKMKIQEYLSHKKQNFVTFFNDNNQSINQLKENILMDKKQQTLEKSQINQVNQIFFQTLNKKQNFSAQSDNPFKKLDFKKKSINQNKENCEQIQSVQKNNNKIKKFLSTKGLNWKIINKISTQKFKSKESKVNKKQNIFGQNRKMISILIKKQLQSKPTQFQENVFRIRKFA